MKKIITLIIVFMFCFSCENEKKQENQVETIVLTVYKSTIESQPLNVILDFNSNKLIVYTSSLPKIDIPPPPPGSLSKKEDDNDENFLNFETEVFEFDKNELRNIFEILNSFKAEDYEDVSKVAYDGSAVRTFLFFSDNTLKTFVSINGSSKNQENLFRIIFHTIYSKSKQEKLINTYYHK